MITRGVIQGLALVVVAILATLAPPLAPRASAERHRAAVNEPAQPRFPTAVVSVTNARGERIALRVEIAATPSLRAHGLMFRRALAPGHGMLLLWPRARRVGIWMKNTFIPLDIVFIDERGTVVRVHENARPHDLTVIPSRHPVLAVLEVAAGEAGRLGLLPGARVTLPRAPRH